MLRTVFQPWIYVVFLAWSVVAAGHVGGGRGVPGPLQLDNVYTRSARLLAACYRLRPPHSSSVLAYGVAVDVVLAV